ncbi:hypothetical protein GOODEAATRI_024180 [Goodea atripinnis]|uniref:C1q domain-containing protein n=1 Tax=Goodea atripinnis TaxID=208336 RepID=A0ABV0Q0M0_9TELE
MHRIWIEVKRNASPADVLRLLKQPSGPSREAVRAADYMDNTLHLIKRALAKRQKRSINATACGSGETGHIFGASTIRQQLNTLSSFIDAGQVYGSDNSLVRLLRNLSTDAGLLRVNEMHKDNGRDLLPFTMGPNMCATRRRITNDTSAEEVQCFLTGDSRANENPGLASLHTLMMREHNRLAHALASLNPQWDGEKLYQEARKIMGGYFQVITYRDWLPHIVGPEAISRQLSTYPGYNKSIDPSIANVFAAAAYRFGHLMVQPFSFRLDENYEEHPQFWWENDGVFTDAQRLAIKDTSLARIICDNTGITEVPLKPFQYRPRGSGYTQCNDIPPFDLSPWREGGPPGTAENVAFSVRLGDNSPKSGTPIPFNDVIYNGQNSYDPETGFFTCKHPGVYEFEFHCNIYESAASLDLLRDGHLVLHSFTTRQSGYITASGSIFIKLKEGDRVWLVANSGGNGLTRDSYFSGHLLFTE